MVHGIFLQSPTSHAIIVTELGNAQNARMGQPLGGAERLSCLNVRSPTTWFLRKGPFLGKSSALVWIFLAVSLRTDSLLFETRFQKLIGAIWEIGR